MGFEHKLEQLCIAADRQATANLKRHTKRLAVLVANVLKTGHWTELPVKTDRNLREAAEAAVDAAELADAANFVSDKLLRATNGRIVDLKMDIHLRTIQQQIYQLFETGKAPSRGFVYVAWSVRPERFMYVGKARQINRLNLVSHGKLSHAAAHVTTLSLLFPTQSLDETLLALEASVVRLVQHSTGTLPELNDRREEVPVGTPSQALKQLAGFLSRVAKSIDPYRTEI